MHFTLYILRQVFLGGLDHLGHSVGVYIIIGFVWVPYSLGYLMGVGFG